MSVLFRLALMTIAAPLGAAETTGATAELRFTDQALERGVADEAVNSTGPAFADYDNDGDTDVFVPVEDLAPGLADRLFQNDGRGRFTDVAAARGVDNPGSLSRGASWGDFDNDGDLDLVVSNMPPGAARQRHVPTTLYRNLLVETGTANFENVTRALGLMRAGNESDAQLGGIGDTGAGVAWADYDGDGDLDLYWKNADGEIESALFRNDGARGFTDVTATSGVAVQERVAESNMQGAPSWTDVDQDGRPDLILTQERARGFVLRNVGEGRFEDITLARRPPSALPFLNPGNAQGACLADFDNDGDLDVYVPLADQANRLYRSRLVEDGVLSYEDITLASGAGDAGGARGCVAADFDNDGRVDLYVNNGGPSNVLINDVIAGFPPFVQFYIAWRPAANVLLRNLGDGRFADVTAGSGAEAPGIGSGVGTADVDGDGFVDVYATNRTYYALGKRVSDPGRTALLMNAGNDNGWFKLALEGRTSNRSALGARVRVTSGDLVQFTETTSAHGYNSANDPVLSFGIGARTRIDAVEVTWPSGVVQTVRDPPLRKLTRMVEPQP